MDASSSSTNTIGQAKDHGDQVDVPEWVKWWDLGQDQHEASKYDHKLIKFHAPIGVCQHINCLQKKIMKFKKEKELTIKIKEWNTLLEIDRKNKRCNYLHALPSQKSASHNSTIAYQELNWTNKIATPFGTCKIRFVKKSQKFWENSWNIVLHFFLLIIYLFLTIRISRSSGNYLEMFHFTMSKRN